MKGQKAEAVAQYSKALSMVGDETNKTRIRGILARLNASGSQYAARFSPIHCSSAKPNTAIAWTITKA